MIAGRLKYKIQLLEPSETGSAFGDGESLAYTPSATVHAERVSITGNQVEEVAELFPNYRVQFRIRSAHRVGEHWRVQELGGYLYNVLNIIPNVDRGMKTLVCERVNE